MIRNGKVLPEAEMRFGGIASFVERVLALVFPRRGKRIDKAPDGMDERMAQYRDRIDS